MKIKDIGEFGLIGRLKAFEGKGLEAGIGEDAAVLNFGQIDLLFTTDLMVEGVHFLKGLTPARAIGHRLLAANLSDLAACGAEPLIYTVLLVVHPEERWEYVKEIYQGMKALGEQFGASLAGGDISRGEQLLLGLALLGKVPRGRWVPRSGARVGDAIFVSGSLGESALGLRQLKRGMREGPFVRRHLFPEPRLDLGRGLSERGLVHAMIDISDGFLQDLGHILEASGVGAEIHLDRLPLEGDYLEECHRMGLDPLELALLGGEDYELIFTAPEGRAEEVMDLGRQLGVRIEAVGRILQGGIRLLKDGRPYPLPRFTGYDHFRWASST